MGSVEDIKYLEAILEENPEKQEVRLILADAYDDIGDPISETLRWMAANDRRPWRNEYDKSISNPVSWNVMSGTRTKSTLPEAIFNLIDTILFSSFVLFTASLPFRIQLLLHQFLLR